MRRRVRPPLETAEQEALKAAIRKAFTSDEEKRDDEHKRQVDRLLRNLEDFEKGRSDDRPAA